MVCVLALGVLMNVNLVGEPSEGQLAVWYAENACSASDDWLRAPEEYLELPLWTELSAALQRRFAHRALAAALGHVDRRGWWGDLAPAAQLAIRQISRAFWRDNRSLEQRQREEKERRLRESPILRRGVQIRRGEVYQIRRGRCAKCKRSVPRDKFHLHHRRPLSQGGKHVFENIQVLCVRCHHRVHHPPG